LKKSPGALGCAFVWSSYSVLSRQLRRAPTEAVAGLCLVTSAFAAICRVWLAQRRGCERRWRKARLPKASAWRTA
jgi:drug/metabolite transporter (DMT)-like permease